MLKVGNKFLDLDSARVAELNETGSLCIDWTDGVSVMLRGEEATRAWEYLCRTNDDLMSDDLKCPGCFGEGGFHVYQTDEDHKSHAEGWVDCKKCNGTGKLFYDHIKPE